MNAAGSGVTRLTDHPALDLTPTWSLDGSRLAFASNRTGSFQIHAMNADGTAVRQRTSQRQDTDPAWSPDGRSISFVRCCAPDGSAVIQVLSLATSQITTAAGRVWPLGGGPTWSPDSSTLACVSTRDGNADIYVVPAAGRWMTPACAGTTWRSTARCAASWDDPRVCEDNMGESDRNCCRSG